MGEIIKLKKEENNLPIFSCRDKKIKYGDDVLIMGIINVTPDSFSDGGRFIDPDKAIEHALELVDEGANILDFGAQSTRPGYDEVSCYEEMARLEPVLTEIRKKTDVPISVDTYFAKVAEKAVEWGVDIINDVSGTFSNKMAKIVKESGCGYIIMHNGSGNSEDMTHFFRMMARKFENYGVDPSQLCFDMGIGFGKDYEQNLDLLANVKDYKIPGYPLLLGTSRKRVIAQGSRQTDPLQRVYGNIAADTAAILGGVDIVRIHDVKNEKQGIYMAQELRKWIK